MSRIRFIMIGGFLGAGKTTAVARLAEHYISQGKNVGLVTNDQANNLVDTRSLRAQGFQVGEVPGACFCCKFDDLVSTVESLSAEERPDVIVTEPVGSCTDLVATVIQPLASLHGNEYDIAPYVVLCKPEHGQKILSGEKQVGFSPKAAYIFLKQLEEADVIILNKIDKLTDASRDELIRRLKSRFPDKQIHTASAKSGEGYEDILAVLESSRGAWMHSIGVDYDLYAEGEAELGWLNCGISVTSSGGPFKLDKFVLALTTRIACDLLSASFEPAHLKVLGQTEQSTSIANQVSSEEPPELSLASQIETTKADLLVNARVAGSPEQLAEIVTDCAGHLAQDFSVRAEVHSLQQFRPGRPEPTHRLTTAS